ncbi:hypothetical protein SCANM63S_09412 [Streptomyces canarius]
MVLTFFDGGHPRTLPLPATYVIDRADTIRRALVNTDYTSRAEPAGIITALDALDRRLAPGAGSVTASACRSGSASSA